MKIARGGGTQYKRPYGDVPPTWVAKSASWYINDPLLDSYFMQNLVYEWDFFFKFEPNWFKFKEILEKSGNFGQNLVQNQADWYMNGSLFLGKFGICMGLLSNFRRHVPTKTKTEYPPPPRGKLSHFYFYEFFPYIKSDFSRCWAQTCYCLEQVDLISLIN